MYYAVSFCPAHVNILTVDLKLKSGLTKTSRSLQGRTQLLYASNV